MAAAAPVSSLSSSPSRLAAAPAVHMAAAVMDFISNDDHEGDGDEKEDDDKDKRGKVCVTADTDDQQQQQQLRLKLKSLT